MAFLDREDEDFDPHQAEWQVDLFFFRLDLSLLPGAVLSVALIALFLVYFPSAHMLDFALSSETIRAGRIATLFTHMVAHAGAGHLWMNVVALVGLSAILVRRLGIGPRQLLACAALLVLSGLAGGLLFLALNPNGAVPMLGASGAICGLLGAVERLDLKSGKLVPLMSVRIVRALARFAAWNLILFLALYLLVSMLDGTGGLAWEAHLGGFAVGLLAAPLLMGQASPAIYTDEQPPSAASGSI